jgi:hypothetical protein
MDPTFHHFSELFAQLGLPDDNASIGEFIMKHRPLGPTVMLADAPFWTTAQAQLLREQLRQDADWAEIIDQLNAALH